MENSEEELTLDIPIDSVKIKHGFSIDFGSSLIKVAHAAPADGKVKLHLKRFSAEQKDEAFSYIRENVDYEPGQEVILTGLGVNHHKQTLERALNIKAQIAMETRCFVDGFMFLTRYVKLEDLVHSASSKVKRYEQLFHKINILSFFSNPKEEDKSDIEAYDHDLLPETVEYPCLLFMCGSVAIALEIEEDGYFRAVDYLPISGRSLLGLGSLVAGAKSFEKLISLAEEGRSGEVDVMTSDMADKSGSQDTYSAVGMDPELVALAFGRGYGKQIDDFKEEDRAAAVVSLVAQNLGVWTQQWATQKQAKHVYFCGSIHTTSQHVRDETHKVFAYRASGLTGNLRPHAHFLKLGGFLGVLGALLRNLVVAGDHTTTANS